ncbi:hypothetical protein B0J12DRAFT_121308 [Macrophomina phaseolina]|uniref:Clr5 domain-containing protein n=1 Tax=Macrophomina phaseolina TaxID=35725 RepID=A0ABQ8G7Q9_9PEZI|nr:hypothetical protein B0J12DRAFT_121308 [Macrophomina phaseolina]
MEDTYGFHATKSQYEGQFRKWNIRKNLRKGHGEQHWKLIKWKIEKRRKQDKETDVYMDGALLQSKKVKKEISRYSISTMEGLVFHNKCPATPPSFNLRTPVLIPASDALVKTDINIRASGPQISILLHVDVGTFPFVTPFNMSDDIFLWPTPRKMPYESVELKKARRRTVIQCELIELYPNTPPHLGGGTRPRCMADF